MNVQRILLQGGAGITGTALLAAAMWLYALRPDVQARELDPIRTEGRIGTVVANDEFRIRVDRVEAARSLAPTLSFGNRPPERTEGIFLIVRTRAMSAKEPLKLGTVQLETSGGVTYLPAARSAASTPVTEFQPMLWTEAAYIFEVPTRTLEGARLVVGTGGLTPQLSAAAEIDLGITASGATQLSRSAAERYDLRKGRP
ncbi:hypothetical protein ACQP1W_03480 [Spirillospora sp. CA-255316]